MIPTNKIPGGLRWADSSGDQSDHSFSMTSLYSATTYRKPSYPADSVQHGDIAFEQSQLSDTSFSSGSSSGQRNQTENKDEIPRFQQKSSTKPIRKTDSPVSSANSSPRFNHKNLYGTSSEESLNTRLRPGATGSSKPNKSENNYEAELKRLIDPEKADKDLKGYLIFRGPAFILFPIMMINIALMNSIATHSVTGVMNIIDLAHLQEYLMMLPILVEKMNKRSKLKKVGILLTFLMTIAPVSSSGNINNQVTVTVLHSIANFGEEASFFCNTTLYYGIASIVKWQMNDQIIMYDGHSVNASNNKYIQLKREGGFELLISNVSIRDIHFGYGCSIGFADSGLEYLTIDKDMLENYWKLHTELEGRISSNGKLMAVISLTDFYPKPKCSVKVNNEVINKKALKISHLSTRSELYKSMLRIKFFLNHAYEANLLVECEIGRINKEITKVFRYQQIGTKFEFWICSAIIICISLLDIGLLILLLKK